MGSRRPFQHQLATASIRTCLLLSCRAGPAPTPALLHADSLSRGRQLLPAQTPGICRPCIVSTELSHHMGLGTALRGCRHPCGA